MLLPKTKSPLSRYVGVLHERSPRSRLLGFIAGSFRITAALSAVSLVSALVAASMDSGGLFALVAARPLAFVLWPFNVVGLWKTGELLGNRQRTGAWMAMGTVVVSILAVIAAHRPGMVGSIVFSALWLACIGSVWRELE